MLTQFSRFDYLLKLYHEHWNIFENYFDSSHYYHCLALKSRVHTKNNPK